MRTKDEKILQNWIPSGDIVTRFFNYENMIAFAKHYEKQKQGQTLPIHNVVLKSEQLIAFMEYLQTKRAIYFLNKEELADEYLKSN